MFQNILNHGCGANKGQSYLKLAKQGSLLKSICWIYNEQAAHNQMQTYKNDCKEHGDGFSNRLKQATIGSKKALENREILRAYTLLQCNNVKHPAKVHVILQIFFYSLLTPCSYNCIICLQISSYQISSAHIYAIKWEFNRPAFSQANSTYQSSTGCLSSYSTLKKQLKLQLPKGYGGANTSMAATSQSTTSNNWTIVSLAKRKSPYKFLEQQLTKLPVPLMLTSTDSWTMLPIKVSINCTRVCMLTGNFNLSRQCNVVPVLK